MMKKIVLLLLVSFLLILSLSCNILKTYEDTNGPDNYMLENITSEMIIKRDNSLETGSVSSKDTKNGITSIIFNVHKFDGVKQLHTFKSGSYAVLVSFKVTSGNTKLVITDGKKIVYEFLVNDAEQEYSFECSNNNYLKIAGEACEFQLSVKIEKR